MTKERIFQCRFRLGINHFTELCCRKRLAIGVSDDEVERGKNMYKTIAFSMLESNVTRADDIAKQVLIFYLVIFIPLKKQASIQKSANGKNK